MNTRPYLWLLFACLVPGAKAQEAPVAPINDILVFRDGDRTSGELQRIEAGAAVFRSFKTGDATVQLSFIQDLRSLRRFAVLRKGLPVSRQNALIGLIEFHDDVLTITPTTGPAVTLKEDEIDYAVDDLTFEREILHHTRFHEGWSIVASVGGSLVRATETGSAFNSDLALTRTLPGVDYLPRRNRTEIRLSDSYEFLRRPDPASTTPIETTTNIFHAGAERNEYLHSRVYVLANYTFDRNYAQGLLAQELIGAGLGITLFKDYPQQLDIKTDLHRESQGFTDPDNNDVLLGQRITIEYQRFLPGNVNLQQNADYLPSYNLPHRYSANSTTTLTVPLFRSLGLSVTATDNYLNNPSPGLKRNTFHLSTSITFSH